MDNKLKFSMIIDIVEIHDVERTNIAKWCPSIESHLARYRVQICQITASEEDIRYQRLSKIHMFIVHIVRLPMSDTYRLAVRCCFKSPVTSHGRLRRRDPASRRRAPPKDDGARECHRLSLSHDAAAMRDTFGHLEYVYALTLMHVRKQARTYARTRVTKVKRQLLLTHQYGLSVTEMTDRRHTVRGMRRQVVITTRE